jgi:hypothetical protein
MLRRERASCTDAMVRGVIRHHGRNPSHASRGTESDEIIDQRFRAKIVSSENGPEPKSTNAAKHAK